MGSIKCLSPDIPRKADAYFLVRTPCLSTHLYEIMFSCVFRALHPARNPEKRKMEKVNNARANKRDWNAYVRIFRRCPWTGVDASPQY